MRETTDREKRLAALTEELENLRNSLPAHSLKPAMLIRIEELDEEIENLKRET
jgi:ribosomal protein L29